MGLNWAVKGWNSTLESVGLSNVPKRELNHFQSGVRGGGWTLDQGVNS